MTDPADKVKPGRLPISPERERHISIYAGAILLALVLGLMWLRPSGEAPAQIKNDLNDIKGLNDKEQLVKSPAEEIRMYDEIIARDGHSSDRRASQRVSWAIQKKLRLIDDPKEKIKLYDELIARSGEPDDPRERAEVAELMISKARFLDDREAQNRLYDEVIARGLNSGHRREMDAVAKAMLEKAKRADDREEKIKLYDAVLFKLIPTHDFFDRSIPFFALQERAELADGTPEKLRLYDRFLAAAGNTLAPAVRRQILLEQVELMDEAADKLRLYDEIIESCELELKAVASGDEDEPSKKFTKELIMSQLGQAVQGQAELLETAEEKLKLYDRYLSHPPTGPPGFENQYSYEFLAKKAELSGDPSVMTDYFDARIQAAATERERAQWYDRKAEAVPIAERAAVDEEIIAQFFDQAEAGVARVVAEALLRKINRLSNPEEKNALCDRLIERYGDSVNSLVLLRVVQAYDLKAEAAPDDEAKIALYSTVIDRYRNLDDYRLKKAVDEAIAAAKARLEMKKEDAAAAQ